jgi:hypothetical protein
MRETSSRTGTVDWPLVAFAVSLTATSLAVSAWVYLATPDEPEHEPITLTACATEDSDNCYWDAATMGNGEGLSFVVIDGTVYYEDVSVNKDRGEGQ